MDSGVGVNPPVVGLEIFMTGVKVHSLTFWLNKHHHGLQIPTPLLRQVCLNFLAVKCGNLPNPRFGRVDMTGNTVGSTATYSCLPGYTLVGTSTRTCQTSGQWSGVAPVCIRK